MKKYFAFAFADSMLAQNESFVLHREPCDAVEIGRQEVISALNPSHTATVEAMQTRYNLYNISIPEKAPLISLQKGDTLYLMTVRGLPRLEGNRQYTSEEILQATFTFSKYTVL